MTSRSDSNLFSVCWSKKCQFNLANTDQWENRVLGFRVMFGLGHWPPTEGDSGSNRTLLSIDKVSGTRCGWDGYTCRERHAFSLHLRACVMCVCARARATSTTSASVRMCIATRAHTCGGSEIFAMSVSGARAGAHTPGRSARLRTLSPLLCLPGLLESLVVASVRLGLPHALHPQRREFIQVGGRPRSTPG